MRGVQTTATTCQIGGFTEVSHYLATHGARVGTRNNAQSPLVVLSHRPRSSELALPAYQELCGPLQRQRTDCSQMVSSITQLLSLRDSSFPPCLLEKLLK